jgi:hypothetical protein
LAALEFPVRWAELDPRIAKMLPASGRLVRTSEHSILEKRFVTRSIEVVVNEVDPLAELHRLVFAIADAGLTLAIDDTGIAARTPGFSVRGHGDPRVKKYELHVETNDEHDDVDLRDELARFPALAPLAIVVELGRFVTRVDCGNVSGRAPHASFTVALDDETRASILAWLEVERFEQDEGAGREAWTKVVGAAEHVVAFERADELGVDEATAFVRAARARKIARGTDAEGLAYAEPVDAAQILDELAIPMIAPADGNRRTFDAP